MGILNSSLILLGIKSQTPKIAVLGIDDGGKKTFLFRINAINKSRQNQQKQLTFNYAIENKEAQNIINQATYQVHDVGYYDYLRKSLINQIAQANAIIYMIDASNQSRLEQSIKQLHYLLDHKELKKKPIAILGNKIDKINALSKIELQNLLRIDAINRETQPIRPLQIFMCSLVKNVGYIEGVKWLIQQLK